MYSPLNPPPHLPISSRPETQSIRPSVFYRVVRRHLEQRWVRLRPLNIRQLISRLTHPSRLLITSTFKSGEYQVSVVITIGNRDLTGWASAWQRLAQVH